MRCARCFIATTPTFRQSSLSRIKTGVGVLTDNPKEVGTDRIVNTLAAYTLHGGPSIVVGLRDFHELRRGVEER